MQNLMRIALLAFWLVSVLAADLDSTTHRTVIPLTQNGRVNGYHVYEQGRTDFEFEAVNVQEPETEKPVTGEGQLEYQCGKIPYIKKLLLNQGRSRRIRVECLILLTPRLIFEGRDNP